jgi:hypothetical protein
MRWHFLTTRSLWPLSRMVSITISTATKSYQGTDARRDKKEISPLFEIACVLVRLYRVAFAIVNANHSAMWSGQSAKRIVAYILAARSLSID